VKILVTGGAGFIGSNLSHSLVEKGFEITALDDFSKGIIENIKNLRIELIKGKIEDAGLINSLKGKGFKFIHHQAALTDTTIDDIKEMMRVNVDGFKNILNLARKEKANLIYASSAGVYGNGPIPMRESQKLSPLNAYALSKVKIEKLATSLAKENKDIRVIGLRYFNVYGPKEAHKKKSASMIWQLACQMNPIRCSLSNGVKKGKSPRIFKYGEQERDFIYLKDVIEATIRAMEVKESGIVNVGTGEKTSFNRIIEILNRVLKTNFKPQYFDNPYKFYQNYTQADINLAKTFLGYKANWNIDEEIKDYLS